MSSRLKSSTTSPTCCNAAALVVVATAALATALAAVAVNAFVTVPSTVSSAFCLAPSSTTSSSTFCMTRGGAKHITTSSLFMSSLPSPSTILSLQLEKPLGLILEEADDHSSSTTGGGVIVTQVNQGGSAYNSPNSALLPTSKVIKVNGRDVSNMSFDDVMDVIVDANSPLDIQFALMDVPTTETSSSSSSSSSGGAVQSNTVTAATTEEVQVVPQYEIGTIVSIRVEQPDNNKPPITLQARVGDNLRKTLLSNKDIELYRGLKKKLGNCGGGGQCGYCAVELVDDDDVNNTAWGKRSDYEDMKIGKKVGTERYRLACMNNIVGPATVRTL